MDETKKVVVHIKTIFGSQGVDSAKAFVKQFASELRSVASQASKQVAKSASPNATAELSSADKAALKEKIRVSKENAKLAADAARQVAKSQADAARASAQSAKEQQKHNANLVKQKLASIKEVEKAQAKAAKEQVKLEAKAAREAAAELRKKEAALKGASAGWGVFRGAVASAVKTLGQFRSVQGGVVAGLKNIHNSIASMAGKLNIFNTIFGRVTVGMLTWQAWRTVVGGFNAIAETIVRSNATMQNSMGTFTALSRGSSESASKFIEILRMFSVTTGASFDELLEGARRLPAKVGENYQAFERLVKIAITLSRIDPVQGLSGAFFALSNALEGGSQGLRSLIQRFEIGNVRQFNRALDETGDAVGALEQMLAESNIDPDSFIGATENTFDVVIAGLKGMATEFIRITTAPAFQVVTDWLAKLRDYLRDNQAEVQALATAIGARLVNGLKMLASFIKEVFMAGQDFSIGGLFDNVVASINTFIDFLHRAITEILNFATQMATAFANVLGAVTGSAAKPAASKAGSAQQEATSKSSRSLTVAAKSTKRSIDSTVESSKALPTVSETFVKSIKDVSGALTSIKEGGGETIKKMVEGLVDGLSSDSLKQAQDSVLNNIINLEGQQLAQEKSIKKLEEWVQEAEDEVEKAREKLTLFDLKTADIPERYTRARRRELELEILKAEHERDTRKEALDVAKEQLETTKEYLSAQKDVLAAIKDSAEAAASGQIDMGYTPPTEDLDAFQDKVDSLVSTMDGKISPTIEKLKSLFSDVGAFIRGFMGADPAGEVTEMYNAGKKFGDSITSIGGSIQSIVGYAKQIFDSFNSGWSQLPDGLKSVLLVLLGITVTPLAGIVTFALNLTMAGTNAAIWLVTAIAAAGPVGILGAAIATATIVVVLNWDNKTMYEWLSGQTIKKIEIIIFAKLGETLQKLLDFLGAPINLNIDSAVKEKVGKMDARSGIGSTATSGIINTMTLVNPGANAATTAGKAIWGTMADYVKGDTSLIDAGAANIHKAFVLPFQEAYDAIIGNSIVPDMVNGVIAETGRMANGVISPMQSLKANMLGPLAAIKAQWTVDFDAMSTAAQIAITLQKQAQAGSKAAGTSSVGGVSKSINTTLKLDAKATRRLMQEGVYDGMAEVMG